MVNDSAEREVKLTSDFLNTARKEEQFQSVLQVVEKSRKDTPDQRKRKIKSFPLICQKYSQKSYM